MRLDPPELVSVSDKVVLLPACTLPNARLVGVAASAPCVTPVPESGRLKLGFAPSEAILTLPGAAPLVFGEKSTFNASPWPAFAANLSASPLSTTPFPLATSPTLFTAYLPQYPV